MEKTTEQLCPSMVATKLTSNKPKNVKGKQESDEQLCLSMVDITLTSNKPKNVMGKRTALS